MASATERAAAESPDAPKPSLVARLLSPLGRLRTLLEWSRRHRLAAVGVGVAALTGLLLVFAGIRLLATVIGGSQEQLTLAMALEAYDVADYVRARQIAETLARSKSLPYDDLGGPPFVIGAITFQDARLEVDPHRRKRLYLVAARYLDEAYKYGFPEGRQAEGLVMLGRSLYRSRQYAESILILREALQQNPHRAAELEGLLAGAYFRDDPPQYEKALAYLAEQIADPQLRADQRHAALLEKTRILLAQGDLDGVRTTLGVVPDQSPLRSEKLALRGQLLLQEGDRLAEDGGADAAREKYTAAVKSIRLAEGADTPRNRTSPKAEYLLGRAYRRLGEAKAAEHQLERTARLQRGTPEGLAAALEAAEVKQDLGKFGEAAAVYRIVLEQAGSSESYRNPWISLDELRERLEAAYAQFLEDGHFDQAVQISEELTPILPEDRSAQLEAEAYHAWGEHLLSQSEELSGEEAAALAGDAYARFRSAGRAYASLAVLRRPTREYPEELWNSASSFLAGHDFRRAVLMLDTYLETASSTRRPPALVTLGEAHLALDQVEEAMPPLKECIERFANHPAVYEARLLAARVEQERGRTTEDALKHLARARALLEDNLHHEALTPRSVEWRDSLFELGRVFYREGVLLEDEARRQRLNETDPQLAEKAQESLQASHRKFQLAAEKLSEAAARYPDSSQAIEARYLMAEGHRHAAPYAAKMRARAVIEATRLALKQQQQQELVQASEAFAALVVRLNEQSDRRELNDIETDILRNAYFGKADALFQQKRYDEALTAYSAAADRLHDRPEVIEALVQMSRCQRELGEWELARAALQRARATINRLPEDTDYTQTTRYDRAGWLRHLEWLITMYSSEQGEV
jgi:tetratricopeptide (TPR) repeat protein